MATPSSIADRLEAAAGEAAAALREIAQPRDWIEELYADDGDALKSDDAAFIADVSSDTIRRYAVAAALAGHPIGILVAGAMWLYSSRRLLDWIEQHQGRPARLKADARARKSRVLRSLPQISSEIPIATAN
jgi:hypothetical protein